MTLKQNTSWLEKACSQLKWELPNTSVGTGVACAAFLLVAVYVWILPIGHTTALRNIVFFTLAILTLWAAWKQGLKLHLPIAWAWGTYVAVALISLSYALDPAYSFSEIKTELGYGVLAFALGATWVRNETSLSRLMVLLLLGNAFLVGYAILQTATWLTDALPGTFGSLNSGPGTFSTYLVTVGPFIAAYAVLNFRKWPLRWLGLVLLAANLAALYFTYNRVALLAIVAEIVVAGALVLYHLQGLSRQRAQAFGALAITVTLGLVVLLNIQMAKRAPTYQADAGSAVSQDPRIAILWPVALDNIHASPVSGGGFGRNAYKLRNPEVARIHPEWWHAHNTFLNKGVQMGLPGILSFILLFGILAWKIRLPGALIQGHPRTALYAFAGIAMIAGVVVKNLTDDFFIRDNALMFWLLAGALAGTVDECRKECHLVA